MLSRTFRSVMIALAFGAATASAQDLDDPIPIRRLTEYQMPPATQTHEFARVPDTNIVLLSQMSNSNLVKIELDPTTEEFVALHSFPMGKDSGSGLHGVWPSTVYPGMMWLSLQLENKLLLVDPGNESWTEPTILQTIDIPAPGNGPHCVFEIGNRVWAGLKEASKQTDKYYVYSADVSDPTDYTLYECLSSPVFIKEEPTTGLIYVTQDYDSSIMRIDVSTGETEQLPIPPSVGNTAVGMTTAYGAMSGVWFTLAGNATGGTGTFGHIGSDGEMKFFQLQNPLGANSGLLHIADATTEDGGPAFWILSTSLLSDHSPDALIHVTFDADATSIVGEEYTFMLTQNSKVHRVVPLESTVLVSELSTFTLAQLSYSNTVAGEWRTDESVNGSAVKAESG
ncbi:hypothetical protein N7455_007307 [Penicillium solitum]|uniref:uncharacterized protein n=1 Tax=Penicillium solitum TaxID=60172 RepID=UPI0017A80C39|nr:hypothetical protein HAV15_013185 [Penicillium sp. str. \